MYPYQNATLSPQQRAEDLLSRMSLSEKMGQIVGLYTRPDLDINEILKMYPQGAGNVSCLEMRSLASLEECAQMQRDVQKAIMDRSEHHIPAIFHMEGLCGAYLAGAASFPSGLGRAAGWDPELERQIGMIVGCQERAVNITQTLAPVLDISHDSRMGRQGETYGEDPALASALGTAFLHGLQKGETAGLHTEAVAKHFLGFHASQGGIHGADCEISERTLRELYGRPFQAAITEGELRGIMPCYCAINGEPVSASQKFLTELLRDEMGFDGITVSDYGAISNIHHVQKVCESEAEAGLRAMAAGMDMELQYMRCYGTELEKWFANGQAELGILDRAVLRVLITKFRMGLFESPFAPIGEELSNRFFVENAPEVSLQSARQSLVLLKNNGILPLKKDIKTLAVIGWHGSTARSFFGGYTHMSMAEGLLAAISTMAGLQTGSDAKVHVDTLPGTVIQKDSSSFDEVLFQQKPEIKNLVQELRERLPDVQVTYALGYPFAGTDTSHFAEALEVASQADAVIVTLGGKYGTGSIASTGEGIDSSNIGLPPCQEQFLQELTKLNRPTIGVHLDGRPISSDAADMYLDAILEAFSPSEGGAQAIVDVLTGRYNPSGRMPVSVARCAGQLPVFYNHLNGSSYHQGESIAFRDYVDLSHKPRYPFGYGLSYTQFTYRNLTLSCNETEPDSEIAVRVTIENTGPCSGFEVIQLYIRDDFASVARPVKELAGFCRVWLAPGEQKIIEFTLHPTQMAFWKEGAQWLVEHGSFTVWAGPNAEELPLCETFMVTKNAIIDGRQRQFFAKSVIL